MTTIAELSERLLRFVEGDDAVHLVTEYFAGASDGSPRFTGAMFNRLAGAGDRPEVADRFTADDLVAVTMLSVEVPPRAALQILLDRAEAFAQLLGAIPWDVDLWDADAVVVNNGSAADRLWNELLGLQGVGWVTAGKLLARKRPRLIPVYDQVVRDALGRVAHFWRDLRSALRSDDRIIDRLESLRDASGQTDLALLRVLDIAIWMRNHGKREAATDRLTSLPDLLP